MKTFLLKYTIEFTKFIFIIPVRNLKDKTTTDVIIKIVFHKFGYPKTIHSDNGSSFRNRIMDELCKMRW